MALGVILLTSSICRAQTRRQANTENDFSPLEQPSTSPASPSSWITFPASPSSWVSHTASLVTDSITVSNDLGGLRDLFLYCTYSDICHYRARYIPANKASCCSSCSCEPSCGVLGNCCDNSLNVNRVRRCYKPLVTDDSKLLRSKDSGYWLIDRCSNSSSATDCTLMTSGPWGSMYPVYDAATDVSYYNQYCAECNGVQEYKNWDVGVTCFLPHVSYSNAVIVGGLFGKGCGVSFKPPREQLDKHVCNPDLIQQCNVTGMWHTYDAELELACSRWYSPVRSQIMDDTFVNVFCLLCNGVPYKRGSHCEAIPPRNAFDTTFTTAIDYRKISSALVQPMNHQPKKWDGVCSKHMVKHPFKVTNCMS